MRMTKFAHNADCPKASGHVSLVTNLLMFMTFWLGDGHAVASRSVLGVDASR